MARCGCNSVGATGAAAEGAGCIDVSGAGTALDPFVVSAILAEFDDQLLSCEGTGLYVPAPTMTAAAAGGVTVTEVGTGPGDYEFSINLGSDTDVSGFNILDIVSGKAVVNSANVNVRLLDNASALDGSPGAPEDEFGCFIPGTELVSLDASAKGHIDFPTVFPNGLYMVVPYNGDSDAEPFVCALVSATGSGFDVQCIAVNDAASVALTSQRINYLALGW